MNKKINKIDFKNLNYDSFKKLANDKSLTSYEKIGFPEEYRKNKENFILEDIINKCSLFASKNKSVLDIGCGCSPLTKVIIDYCVSKNHKLALNDSEEMLSLIENGNYEKISGFYPSIQNEILKYEPKGFDVILCYSVFHYIIFDSNMWDFLDSSISILKNGGQMLIGDIPNLSKRKRFFSSENGIKFHQDFMKTKDKPIVEYNKVEPKELDDSILDAIVQRARNCGCDAYILPQNKNLPMANRRDDILILKP